MLKRGRSAPFIDPSLTALEARHIWMPAPGQPILSAVAERVGRVDQHAVLIPELPVVEHILIDPEGRQHVLLRADGCAFQLQIEGADVVSGPVALTFLIRGIKSLGRTAQHLSDLRRILSVDATAASAEPRWTTRARNLRDALVVFDGRAAGVGYRQAADVLHGTNTVERDWRDGGLRHRMRRNWLRGHQFVSGAYRNFLT